MFRPCGVNHRELWFRMNALHMAREQERLEGLGPHALSACLESIQGEPRKRTGYWGWKTLLPQPCVAAEILEERHQGGRDGRTGQRQKTATSLETDSSAVRIACVHGLCWLLCREGLPSSEKLLTPCYQITTTPCMYVSF